MKKIKLAVISIAALLGVMTLVPSYVGASPASQIQGGVNQAGGSGQSSNLGAQVKIIVNILLYILGAIAVVMIVIGGIRYTTSNGDSSAITSAKNTILYSVIGLVVAILAYSIVNFVLTQFK
jgi:ABC-type Fe3+ transport system permease subunit